MREGSIFVYEPDKGGGSDSGEEFVGRYGPLFVFLREEDNGAIYIAKSIATNEEVVIEYLRRVKPLNNEE